MANYFTNNTDIILAPILDSNRAIFNSEKIIFYKEYNICDIIGEAIAKFNGVKIVDYFLFSLANTSKIQKFKNVGDTKIYIGSFDFCKDDVCYFNYSDLIKDSDGFDLERVLFNCYDSKSKEDLLNEILDMFALDTYMMQQDRLCQNIMFELHSNYEIHLSPLFDYEDSLGLGISREYNQDFIFYPNPLYSFKEIFDYKKFMELYPSFREKLSCYQDINLCKIIEDDFKRRNFDISRFYLDYFNKFEYLTQDNIQKILRL